VNQPGNFKFCAIERVMRAFQQPQFAAFAMRYDAGGRLERFLLGVQQAQIESQAGDERPDAMRFQSV
jgi:hypothetical protein